MIRHMSLLFILLFCCQWSNYGCSLSLLSAPIIKPNNTNSPGQAQQLTPDFLKDLIDSGSDFNFNSATVNQSSSTTRIGPSQRLSRGGPTIQKLNVYASRRNLPLNDSAKIDSQISFIRLNTTDITTVSRDVNFPSESQSRPIEARKTKTLFQSSDESKSIIDGTNSSQYGKVVILSNGVEFKIYTIASNSSKLLEPRITLKLDRLDDRHRHFITSIDYTFDETHETCKSSSAKTASDSSDSGNKQTDDNLANVIQQNADNYHEKRCLVIFWLDDYLKEIRTAGIWLPLDSQSHIIESLLDFDTSVNTTIINKIPQISLRYFGTIANSTQRFKHRDHNTRNINDLLIDHESNTLFLSIKQGDESFILASNIYNPSIDHEKYDISPASADKLNVDTRERILFYLDSSGSINRLSLTNRTSLVLVPNVRAKSLTIHKQEKRLYWLTADGYLYSINYYGLEKRCVKHLRVSRALFEPYAMRIVNNSTLYLTDTSHGSLIKVQLYSNSQNQGQDLISNDDDSSVDSDPVQQQDDGDYIVLAVESPAIYGFQFIDKLTLSLIKSVPTSSTSATRSISNSAVTMKPKIEFLSVNQKSTEKSTGNKTTEQVQKRVQTHDSPDAQDFQSQVQGQAGTDVVVHDLDWQDELELSRRQSYAAPHQTSSLWQMFVIIGAVTCIFVATLATLYCVRRRAACFNDGNSPLINDYSQNFSIVTATASTSKITASSKA